MEPIQEQLKSLAAEITRCASRQTYQTVRYLVDRGRVGLAYAAYAYFRWVDDTLDAVEGSPSERRPFVQRQQALLTDGYRGEPTAAACAEEQLLLAMIRSDTKKASGLQTYLRNMMAVMAFDAERRGRVITQAELAAYTYNLASAVTEAMHYFIGHGEYAPQDETRYLAVTAAHITHMLRDTEDDIAAGYYNIPAEALAAGRIEPHAVHSPAYRVWVRRRVRLAQAYFQAGRGYLRRVANWRCRLAGLAYTARFEGLLETIENDGYNLRPSYVEQKSLSAGWRMGWSVLAEVLNGWGRKAAPQTTAIHPQ
jgi:hypothetical protein